MLEPGCTGKQTLLVDESVTAKTVGSGTLDVLATPVMIAQMEKAAWMSVTPALEEGTTTVGTMMQVKHLQATPLGLHLYCEAELLEVDGRRLLFRVTASDESGLVGEGTHERFMVQADPFQAKANQKRLSSR